MYHLVADQMMKFTSHNGKCPIPSELVSKIHKCDVGVQQAQPQCPPNWLLSEERGASSLSLPLTSRISARARARRAYAHVHVPPGRDGAAQCTAQRTRCSDDTQNKSQTKKTVATERALPQTKEGGTHIRISARAYADVHVPPGQEGAALCTAQRTGSCDSTQKKSQMKMASRRREPHPKPEGETPTSQRHVRTCAPKGGRWKTRLARSNPPYETGPAVRD